LVLTIAVLRIRRIVNKVKGTDIQSGRLLLHLITFWLYFVSYLIYYILYEVFSTRDGLWFLSALLITVLTETISVVLLTYIIWEIYCISLEQQIKDRVNENV
jgi:hypothetical protein